MEILNALPAKSSQFVPDKLQHKMCQNMVGHPRIAFCVAQGPHIVFCLLIVLVSRMFLFASVFVTIIKPVLRQPWFYSFSCI